MKKLNVMIPLLLFAIIYTTSCHKDLELSMPNTQASEYFPNSVGDKWIYNVYDSINKKMDEVSIEIIGTTTLPKGEHATVWTYNYPDRIDTSFVFESGDTIKFVPALNLNPNDYVVKKKYVIPFSIGNFWTNAFLYDTIHVITETHLTVNNLQFDSTYFLKEKGETVNYFIYAEEYFKPNVGMVQLSKWEYDFFIPENKVWYLKQYFLK